ncbi:MAG: Ig-like domain-containing protein, partial [Bacteroidota bacterium]|nr:Ig-like domain-containing protein [Bacteroidota bacterium]
MTQILLFINSVFGIINLTLGKTGRTAFRKTLCLLLMGKTSFFTVAMVLIIMALYTILPMGCANIIPPSGGPKDSTAPRLVSAVPKDSTLNFKGNRITFTFDEYIADPQDLQNNLLFTPTFEINPEIAIRGKTMTLRFHDSLMANTTYIFNFGNAIQDVNEHNVLRNFVYTFSTGAALDSLTLSGKVIVAQTGKPDSTLIVILHRNLSDSAVIKERPVYVSRVDAGGNFHFQNLPPGNFAIYALGDAGLLRRFNAKSLFAFADEVVSLGKTKDIELYAYREAIPQSPAISLPSSLNRGVSGSERRLRFTPPTGNLDLQSDYILNFPIPLRRFDSSLVSLSTDTTFIPVNYTVSLDSARMALRFRSRWKEGTRYNLILNREFAEDTSGRKLLKTDTLNFLTKNRNDYGQLKIRVRNVDLTKNPVLLFVQNDQVVFSASIKSGTFTSTLFNPGDYELR